MWVMMKWLSINPASQFLYVDATGLLNLNNLVSIPHFLIIQSYYFGKQPFSDEQYWAAFICIFGLAHRIAVGTLRPPAGGVSPRRGTH